jgi:hypothetical protein
MKTPEQNSKEQQTESAETLDGKEKPTLKRPEEVEVEVKKRLEKTASVNEKINDTEKSLRANIIYQTLTFRKLESKWGLTSGSLNCKIK